MAQPVHPALTKPMTTEPRPEASSDMGRPPEDEETPTCQIAARLDSEFNRWTLKGSKARVCLSGSRTPLV